MDGDLGTRALEMVAEGAVMKEEIDHLREEIERRDTGQRAVLRAEHARGATS